MKFLSNSSLGLAACLWLISFSANSTNWGSFSKYGCYEPGLAKYAAILWDIPWGHDWETACAAQPAYINGYHFEHPKACRNHSGINMWGEWAVPDKTCG